MKSDVSRALLGCAAMAALAGCGGGGGSYVTSTPPPPVMVTPSPTPMPTPTPTPTPTAPIPPAHFALVSDRPFAALGVADTYTTSAGPFGDRHTLLLGPSLQDVQFSFDPSNGDYFITLPGFRQGILGNTGYNGSAGQVATGSTSQVLDLAFGTPIAFVTLPVPGSSFSPYTYTSFGEWSSQAHTDSAGQVVQSEGIFAYGIPTAPGDVPTTGSASYTAQIVATMGPDTYPPNGIGGDVNLLFNFGAGSLSGSMHPRITDAFDGIFVDFGRFDFKNTVYSTGSTIFSGEFVVPGLPNASSSFNGNFTGSSAAELMARFQTPFLLNGSEGTISGVWIGKKN